MKINMKIEDKDIKRVVPPLRFPEFRDAEGWGVTTLKSICKITNGKCNAQDHIEGGIYPLFDRSETRKASNSYLFDCEAVIIPGEGMRFTPKYYIGKFNLHQRAYALKDFSCIGLYIYYLMEHRSDLLSINAVKSTVLSLRLPILQDFPIETPKNLREQKKIADCLSSLDDLINAVTDKIEALKEYKKGLMQQLFPAEGKTTPALRFPEFQNAGEWEDKTLGGVCNSIASGKNKYSINGDYDLYGSTGIIGKTEAGDYNGSHILVARVGANAGLLTKADGQFGVTDNTLVIIPKNNNSIDFIYHYLYNLGLNNLAFGSGQPLITGGQLKKLKINIPSFKEQLTIAGCFHYIDSLINAQTDNLDQLKVHKKGLMQQLFPTLNK